MMLHTGAIVSVAVYALFCAIILVSALVRPVANWDALAYVGAVVKFQGETRTSVIHAKAYDAVRQAVAPEDMRDLTEAGHYRRVQARDADAFVSMLPMYEVKGGYIALVSALSRLTDPISVMRGLSLVSTMAILIAIAVVFHRLGALNLLGLSVPVLSALQIRDLATLCTPDAPAAALFVWAAALIIIKGTMRPSPAALGLLVAAVALRPDLLVATAGLPVALVAGSAFVALRDGATARDALLDGVKASGLGPWLAAIAGLFVYSAAKSGVPHPGWWAHFSFSVVAQQDTMQGFAPAFDLKVYVGAIVRVTVRMLRDETWPWLVLAMAGAGLLVIRLRDLHPVLVALTLFAVGILVTRMVAFPLPDARLATPIVVMLVMIAAGLAAPKMRTDPPQRASS